MYFLFLKFHKITSGNKYKLQSILTEIILKAHNIFHYRWNSYIKDKMSTWEVHIFHINMEKGSKSIEENTNHPLQLLRDIWLTVFEKMKEDQIFHFLGITLRLLTIFLSSTSRPSPRQRRGKI